MSIEDDEQLLCGEAKEPELLRPGSSLSDTSVVGDVPIVVKLELGLTKTGISTCCILLPNEDWRSMAYLQPELNATLFRFESMKEARQENRHKKTFGHGDELQGESCSQPLTDTDSCNPLHSNNSSRTSLVEETPRFNLTESFEQFVSSSLICLEDPAQAYGAECEEPSVDLQEPSHRQGKQCSNNEIVENEGDCTAEPSRIENLIEEAEESIIPKFSGQKCFSEIQVPSQDALQVESIQLQEDELIPLVEPREHIVESKGLIVKSEELQAEPKVPQADSSELQAKTRDDDQPKSQVGNLIDFHTPVIDASKNSNVQLKTLTNQPDQKSAFHIYPSTTNRKAEPVPSKEPGQLRQGMIPIRCPSASKKRLSSPPPPKAARGNSPSGAQLNPKGTATPTTSVPKSKLFGFGSRTPRFSDQKGSSRKTTPSKNTTPKVMKPLSPILKSGAGPKSVKKVAFDPEVSDCSKKNAPLPKDAPLKRTSTQADDLPSSEDLPSNQAWDELLIQTGHLLPHLSDRELTVLHALCAANYRQLRLSIGDRIGNEGGRR